MTYINETGDDLHQAQEGGALRQLVAHNGICMGMVGLAWLFESVIHDCQRLSTTTLTTVDIVTWFARRGSDMITSFIIFTVVVLPGNLVHYSHWRDW